MCVCAHDTPRYQPVCRQPTGELLPPSSLSPVRCLSASLILSSPLSSLLPPTPLAIPLFLLPPQKLEKGEEEGGGAGGGGVFLDEIRMYVPPYPDLVRGIRRSFVQGRRRGRTTFDRRVDVNVDVRVLGKDESPLFLYLSLSPSTFFSPFFFSISRASPSE